MEMYAHVCGCVQAGVTSYLYAQICERPRNPLHTALSVCARFFPLSHLPDWCPLGLLLPLLLSSSGLLVARYGVPGNLERHANIPASERLVNSCESENTCVLASKSTTDFSVFSNIVYTYIRYTFKHVSLTRYQGSVMMLYLWGRVSTWPGGGRGGGGARGET